MTTKTEPTACEACKEREERLAKADRHLAVVGVLLITFGLMFILPSIVGSPDGSDS
jgi:hypothetical protein